MGARLRPGIGNMWDMQCVRLQMVHKLMHTFIKPLHPRQYILPHLMVQIPKESERTFKVCQAWKNACLDEILHFNNPMLNNRAIEA